MASNIFQFVRYYSPPNPNEVILSFGKVDGWVFTFDPYFPPPDFSNVIFTFGGGATNDYTIYSYPVELEIDINDSIVGSIVSIQSEDFPGTIGISDSVVTILMTVLSENIDISIAPSISELYIIPVIESFISLEINPSIAITSGGQYENLPLGGNYIRAIWNNSNEANNNPLKASWETADTINNDVSVNHIDADHSDDFILSKWIGIQPKAELFNNVKFNDFVDYPGREESYGFKGIMPFADRYQDVLWDEFLVLHSINIETSYLHPDKKDKPHTVVWGEGDHSDDLLDISYLHPFPQDKNHRTYWGAKWYSLFCGTKYFPPSSGDSILFKFFEDTELIPFDGVIAFGLDDVRSQDERCPYDHPYSGPRDPFIPYDDPPYRPPETQIKGFYYIMNSTFIQRISGAMEDINFQSVSMSIDRDSWLWSFSIVILSKASLNLIKPQGQTFADIVINCNGWKWTCRVENWQESISFGKKSWTVTGKSTSVELGEPYSHIPAFTNDEAHGGQIIEDVLTTSGSGWSVDWQNYTFDPTLTWLIPANTFSLTDTSLLKVVQKVSSSVYGFIQTNANTEVSQGGTKKLIIQPKYRENPWKWNTMITPDVVLTDAVCEEIGRSNTTKQYFNAATVYGENNGCIVNGVKDGTAGDKSASVVSDALITTMESGQEAVRHIIGDSGPWISHTFKLFSLMPPGQAPGLMLPGKFITMNETGETSWTGQVTGVSISSGWGGNGLTTSQNIEVEQYIGD